MNQYPSVFLERMKTQLSAEYTDFISALQLSPCRGIRFNRRKPVDHSIIDGIREEIPWNKNTGFYLDLESKAGAHPLHECGAYYIQEPSAMAPVNVLQPKPGEHILDLCAAPGGKSTQIADFMAGDGILVCNEPLLSRAKILSRNIERMGISNSLVISADPAVLAEKWPEHFNAVLVDAPCSGEGMFRRHPETALEWNESSASVCAQRQAMILDAAAVMTAPGGRLVYSTCTHNSTEDDETVAKFLERHPDWNTVAFCLQGNNGLINAEDGTLHLYPHRIKGEGHFIALLHKAGNADPAIFFQTPQMKIPKTFDAAYHDFQSDFGELPRPDYFFGETAICVPELPNIDNINVLRAGVQLGFLKGKIFSPDHALALALPLNANVRKTNVSIQDAVRYQHGDVLTCSDSLKGYVLPCLMGLPLGFGKAGNGQLKNHYPKGLRKTVNRDFKSD